MELAALEASTGAEQERQVGAEPERDDRPPADGFPRVDEDDEADERGGQSGIAQPAPRLGQVDGGCVHGGSFTSIR
jgi:hypothetical protein